MVSSNNSVVWQICLFLSVLSMSRQVKGSDGQDDVNSIKDNLVDLLDDHEAQVRRFFYDSFDDTARELKTDVDDENELSTRELNDDVLNLNDEIDSALDERELEDFEKRRKKNWKSSKSLQPRWSKKSRRPSPAECYDFKFLFARQLDFPNDTTEDVSIKWEDLKVKSFVNRAVTTMKISRNPYLVSRDLVYSVFESILQKTKDCPSMQMRRIVVYGLSNSLMDAQSEKPSKHEKRSLKIYNELFSSILEILTNTEYKGLTGAMKKLAQSIHKELKKDVINVSEVEKVIKTNVDKLMKCPAPNITVFQTLKKTLLQGVEQSEILSWLQSRRMGTRRRRKLLKTLRNLSKTIGERMVKVLDAMLSKNKEVLVDDILSDDQFKKLTEVMKSLESKDEVKREMEDFLAELENETDYRLEKRSAKISEITNILKSLISSVRSKKALRLSRKQNRRRTKRRSSTKILMSHCINFNVAVQDIMGGFPSLETPVSEVNITKNDVRGLIEKSLTLYGFVRRPALITQELLFSIAEKVLEQQKHCPSSILGRQVYYVLGRSFDGYEIKMSNKTRKLLKKVGEKDAAFVKMVELVNHGAVFSLLNTARNYEYMGTKKRLQKLFRPTFKAFKKKPTATSIEKALFKNSDQLTFKCNSNVAVRKYLARTKSTLSTLSRTVKYRAWRKVSRLKISARNKVRIVNNIASMARGFLKNNLDPLFKALISRDDDYLLKKKILTKEQFSGYEKALALIGGQMLPSFASPVTKTEFDLLLKLQDAVFNGYSKLESEDNQLITRRCKELKYVYVPKVSTDQVKTFMDNCEKLIKA